MSLTAGSQLGPYAIQSPLGAGGMGEVYRARDSRLERDVALKVLPASLASDPVARERLRREAIAAASLDHPYHTELSQAVLNFFTGDAAAAIRQLEPVAATEPMTSWAQVSRSVLFFLLAYAAPDETGRVRAALPALLPVPDGPEPIRGRGPTSAGRCWDSMPWVISRRWHRSIR